MWAPFLSYALRYRAIRHRLIDQNHELFTEQSLKRLRAELEWPQGAAICEEGGLAEHRFSLRSVRRSGPMFIPAHRL